MVLFVCFLKDYRHAESLLLALLEAGISGATVLEGRGMGQVIGGEVPIFAALRGLFPGSTAPTQVLLSVVDSALGPTCLTLAERIAGPLSRPGAGLALLLPVADARGLKPAF